MLSRLRPIFKVCLYNMKLWSSNPRIYIVGVLSLIIAWTGANEYIQYLSEYQIVPNLIELYIVVLSDFYTFSYALFCIFLILCDAPFIYPGTNFVLIRAQRKNWAMGQVLYIFSTSLLYYVFLFFLVIIVHRSNGFLSNVWSQKSYIIVNNSLSFSEIFGNIIYIFTPISAATIMTTLNILYVNILSLIIYIVNSNRSKGYGFALISIVHVLGYLAEFSGSRLLRFISPVIHSTLQFHNFGYNNQLPTISMSFGFLLFIYSGLIVLVYIRSNHLTYSNDCVYS